MDVNVGNTDKALRLITGIVIVALGYYFESWWGLTGLVVIATGLFGRCGLYGLFGVSTCRAKEKAAKR